MIAYKNDELISSSEFSKKFGSYLAQIKDKTVSKFAVLKNNKIEAILVSKDAYEKMQEALHLQELAQFQAQIYDALDEAEEIKSSKKKAHKIETLWDEI